MVNWGVLSEGMKLLSDSSFNHINLKIDIQARTQYCCVAPFEVRFEGDLGADLARQQSLGLT